MVDALCAQEFFLPISPPGHITNFINRDYTPNYVIVRVNMNPVEIILENNDFIIINKPSGVVVHPYDFSDEITLLNFLIEKIPGSFKIKNEITLQDKRVINLGGIVHRLDRDTSGVMVIAKNQSTFNELKEQFQDHKTKKIYLALVEGLIDRENFVINSPLGRNKKDYKQVANPSNPRGELRNAITNVKVIKRMGDRNITLVELVPLTGRTHQLRAHMSFVGHPIVGDVAYGSKIESPRIMLHAKSLSFTLDGKEYFFEAEVPENF